VKLQATQEREAELKKFEGRVTEMEQELASAE